jgi:hypothetical protein
MRDPSARAVPLRALRAAIAGTHALAGAHAKETFATIQTRDREMNDPEDFGNFPNGCDSTRDLQPRASPLIVWGPAIGEGFRQFAR